MARKDAAGLDKIGCMAQENMFFRSNFIFRTMKQGMQMTGMFNKCSHSKKLLTTGTLGYAYAVLLLST